MAHQMLAYQMYGAFFYNGPFPASFSFLFIFSISISNKLCRWLDSNCWPLVSEATAQPTEPQPLPYGAFLCTKSALNLPQVSRWSSKQAWSSSSSPWRPPSSASTRTSASGDATNGSRRSSNASIWIAPDRLRSATRSSWSDSTSTYRCLSARQGTRRSHPSRRRRFDYPMWHLSRGLKYFPLSMNWRWFHQKFYSRMNRVK